MKKNLLILLVLLFVLGFAFNSYAEPKGTLRIAERDFFYESTDPIFWESFWGWAMYDPLITYDSRGMKSEQ